MKKTIITTALIMFLLSQNLIGGEIKELYKSMINKNNVSQINESKYKDEISKEIIQSYVNTHKNERTIIIDKSSKQLYLYENNKLTEKFPVPLALGFDPIGDKEIRGDGRTPEGDFFVYDKHPSKYFTFFLELSYPNTEDIKRGLKKKLITKKQSKAIKRGLERINGEIRSTKLGDAIGIHTSGGETKYGLVTNNDWTLGCIAIEYADMEKLYKITRIGDNILSIGEKYKSQFKEEKGLIKSIINTKLEIDNLLKNNKQDEAEKKIEEIIEDYNEFNTNKITVDNYKLNKRISKILHYKSQIEFSKTLSKDSNNSSALAYAIKAYKLEPLCNPIKQNLAKQIVCDENNNSQKYDLSFALKSINEALDGKIIRNRLEAKVIKAHILFKQGKTNEAIKIITAEDIPYKYRMTLNYLEIEMKNNNFNKEIYDALRVNINL